MCVFHVYASNYIRLKINFKVPCSNHPVWPDLLQSRFKIDSELICRICFCYLKALFTHFFSLNKAMSNTNMMKYVICMRAVKQVWKVLKLSIIIQSTFKTIDSLA